MWKLVSTDRLSMVKVQVCVIKRFPIMRVLLSSDEGLAES